jgi:hypothetical protein
MEAFNFVGVYTLVSKYEMCWLKRLKFQMKPLKIILAKTLFTNYDLVDFNIFGSFKIDISLFHGKDLDS